MTTSTTNIQMLRLGTCNSTSRWCSTLWWSASYPLPSSLFRWHQFAIEIRPISHPISCHQSQLDTDGQGVLRNIWLTAVRLSIAGAVSIGLNMIIKVNEDIWDMVGIFETDQSQRWNNGQEFFPHKCRYKCVKCGIHHFCDHAGVDEPDSWQPHIQVSEKQTLKVQAVLNADDRQKKSIRFWSFIGPVNDVPGNAGIYDAHFVSGV